MASFARAKHWRRRAARAGGVTSWRRCVAMPASACDDSSMSQEQLLTLIVATVSALISLVSAVVSIMVYRSSGPRTSVTAIYGPVYSLSALASDLVLVNGNALTVTAYNNGRASPSLDLERLMSMGASFGESVNARMQMPRHQKRRSALDWRGPVLPYRLESDDKRQWLCSMDPIQYDLGREPRPDDEISLVVRVGSKTRIVPVRFRIPESVFVTYPIPS